MGSRVKNENDSGWLCFRGRSDRVWGVERAKGAKQRKLRWVRYRLITVLRRLSIDGGSISVQGISVPSLVSVWWGRGRDGLVHPRGSTTILHWCQFVFIFGILNYIDANIGYWNLWAQVIGEIVCPIGYRLSVSRNHLVTCCLVISENE